jgi:hypothetical protein
MPLSDRAAQSIPVVFFSANSRRGFELFTQDSASICFVEKNDWFFDPVLC